MKDIEKMEKAPLGRLLLSNCIHSSIALLLYSIYSLTDTLIIAWGVSSTAAGAVSVVSPLLLVLSAVSTTMGAGGASMISRALGKENQEQAAHVAANVFVTFWAFAILVTIAGLLFLEPILLSIGASGALYPYAREYAIVILIGAVTSTGFSSLIRAEGAMKFAMKIWLVPIIVNIGLDILFVLVLKGDVFGAALATVLSQVISTGMSIWFFFMRKDRTYQILRSHFRPDFMLMKEICTIGFPSFISQISTSVIVVLMNRFLEKTGGEEAVIAFGFAAKIQTLLLLPQSGIQQGVQPIIGYNYTHGNKERVSLALKRAMQSSFVYGLIVTLCGILLGPIMMRLFTSELEIILLGATVLRFMILLAALQGYVPLISMYYQAVGYAASAMLIILGMLILKSLVIALMGSIWGISGIFRSFAVADVITCLGTAVYRNYIEKGGRRK